MRCCIVFEDSSKSNFGGGQRVSYQLLKTLNSFDIRLNLIDFTDSSDFFNSSKYYTVSSLVLKKFNVNRKTNWNSFSFSIFEVLGTLLLIPLNLFLLLRYIQSHSKGSVIICTTKKTMLFGWILKFVFSDIKLVFHIHNYLRDTLFWSDSVRHIVSKSDENWFVSESVKLSYGKYSHGMILYNPVSLDFKFRDNDSIKYQFNVGVVSSLFGYKGVSYFLSSFFILPNELHGRIQFHVYGDGPQKVELQRTAKDCDFIHFHGFVADTNDIYKNIDILVCPSIDEEAFSLVLFEATCNSIPIIATNLEVHREFFSSEALLFVEPKNSQGISVAIERLVKDYELRSSLVKNARAQIKGRFEVSFESRLKKLYDDL